MTRERSSKVGRSLIIAVGQFLVVTLVSLALLRHGSTDPSYQLAGRNPSEAEIALLQSRFGRDTPFLEAFAEHVRRFATLDWGHSWMTGEAVTDAVVRSLPTSLALVLPALFLGHVAALLLAGFSAIHRGRWQDKLTRLASVVALSTSVLLIMIGLQWLLSSPNALQWLPARGWDDSSLSGYLRHAALPSLVLIVLVTAVNLRFYRALVLDQMKRPYAAFAATLGMSATQIVIQHVWPNIKAIVWTRIVFSAPPVVVGGSFVIENYFGVPGIGKLAYDALLNGDRPVAMVVFAISAILIIAAQVSLEASGQAGDQRVAP